MDAQNNNYKDCFWLDADIINSHIAVSKKDKSGKAFGYFIHIYRRENKIHIKTTDGVILFHSILDDSNRIEGGKDFDAMVKIDKPFKYAKRLGGHIIVGLYEDDISFHLIDYDYKMVFPLVRGVHYPNTDSVENFDGTVPTYYQPFNPKYMQMIVDYLGGLNKLAHPVCQKSGEYEGAYKFVSEDSKCKKIAVVMPMLIK